MKKLMILAVILVSMVMATVALAGPGGPWVYSDSEGTPVEMPQYCDHPSPGELDGYWYVNLNSGNVHCFNI